MIFPTKIKQNGESFPNETAFPDGLFFIPKWDLTQANTKLQALRVEARLADNVNAQIVRITTALFCESVGQDSKLLMNTPFSEKWQIPRFRNKDMPFPWIQQVLQKQQDVATNCLTTQVTCVTQLSLEKWKSLSSLEIRNALPPRPGPLKRFKAARNRTANIRIHLKDTTKIDFLNMTFAHTYLSQPGPLLSRARVAESFLTFLLSRGT